MKRPFDIVCALVRNRVLDAGEEIPAGVDWEAVLECAVRQEVNAICYEAVKALPADRQPSFALMMKWDVSAQAIREMYSLRLKAASEVCNILGANGIRPVMLKGLTLAPLYPEPSERESADVDILTFHDRAKADDVMRSHGIEVTGDGHHTSFKYNGILFENHGTDVKWDFNFRRSDYRVLGFLDRHAADALPGPEGFMMLPPAVTAVFLVKHLKQHLRWNVKVNVKQFTDLALLLRANPGILDDVLSGLKSVGLRHFGKTMMRVSEKVTGATLRIKADILSRAAAAFIVKCVLPLPKANNILLQYSIVARDIIVSRLHRRGFI